MYDIGFRSIGRLAEVYQAMVAGLAELVRSSITLRYGMYVTSGQWSMRVERFR
jgi:hypothetical protein